MIHAKVFPTTEAVPRTSLRPSRMSSGLETQRGCHLIDITELKQADEKLQEKVRALETINDMMIDRELQMVELNEDIERLTDQLQRHGPGR